MRRLFLSLVVSVACSLPAVAQEFQIIESSPAPRDSSVSMEATITFTFNAPVDTSARFDGEGPLVFYSVTPELSIDSSYVSEDLTEFSFEVTHHDTTDYVWILTAAESVDGQTLCLPYALSYTTRSNWGRGVVHGSSSWIVLVKSGSCRTGVVALLDAPPDSSARIAAAGNVDDGASFEITGVRDGTYWPVSFFDWDGDHLIRPQWSIAGDVVSEVGIYNPDYDEEPDSIVVTDTTRIEIHVMATGGSIEGAELPGTARLLQGYPNPFDRHTTLAFELERPLDLTISIHDVLGRRVATPVSGFYPMGLHEVSWSPSGLASGFYVVRLAGEDFVLTRTLVYVGD